MSGPPSRNIGTYSMDHQKCHILLLLLQSDFWLLILPSQLTVNQNSDHVLAGKKLVAGEARYDTFGMTLLVVQTVH